MSASGAGTGIPAASQDPQADAFTVPGADARLAGEAASERATGDGSQPMEAEIYLDVGFAASMDWLAPAALLAVPALLIALSLLAQLVGGMLWIPLTNRVLGGLAPHA